MIIGGEVRNQHQSAIDSRKVTAGRAVRVHAGSQDATRHSFAPQAVEKRRGGAAGGARASALDVPQVVVEDVRTGAFLCGGRRFTAIPPMRVQLIGITGTKGKTTTSFLLKSILEEAG